jgi:carboxymethylenebutenolidase
MARMAEALAADGYVVLAPDAYRGRLSVSVPGALLQTLLSPQNRIDRDLDQALEHLRAMESVDPARIAVAGFCFGGTQAMKLGIRHDWIRATAIFYGSGIVTDRDAIGSLGAGGPVLGIFGEEDRSIPLEKITAFEAALKSHGVDATIRVFPDVGHGFVHPQAVIAGGIAREAWNLFRIFLRDSFSRPRSRPEVGTVSGCDCIGSF